MSKSIATEARIFARQVGREAKRRELIGAKAISDGNEGDWQRAVRWLAARLSAEPSPVKRVACLQAACNRLSSIPKEDKGAFIDIARFGRKRTCELMFATFLTDDHPMEAMTGLEAGITTQCHYFKITRSGPELRIGVIVASVSDHALGRFWERAHYQADINEGFALLRMCGRAGVFVTTEPRLHTAEINIRLNSHLIATGSTRVASQGEVVSSFFDCRTVLPQEACSDGQIAQANAFAAVFEGKATVGAIPFLSRRNDFVMETLKRLKEGD